jgi:hypothetical protein
MHTGQFTATYHLAERSSDVPNDLIVFHVQSSQNGLDHLFVRALTSTNDWQMIGTSTISSSEATRRNAGLLARLEVGSMLQEKITRWK